MSQAMVYPSPLDRTRQVAPQIAELLRQRILSLQMKPNAVLSRAMLQEEFGVSQTPVRDALMKLAQEGLVEIYPQSSTIVSRIDVGAARQAHFLRRAIELEAVRQVAENPNPQVIQALRDCVAEQMRSSAAGQHEAFNQADRAFHRVFYAEAKVMHLWDLVRRESGHIDRLRVLNLPLPGKIDTVMKDHESLIAAVERGDPEGAAAVLRRHLSGTLAIIDEIKSKYPDYLNGL